MKRPKLLPSCMIIIIQLCNIQFLFYVPTIQSFSIVQFSFPFASKGLRRTLPGTLTRTAMTLYYANSRYHKLSSFSSSQLQKQQELQQQQQQQPSLDRRSQFVGFASCKRWHLLYKSTHNADDIDNDDIDNDKNLSSNNGNANDMNIRFLGKGSSAIIRPGVVLLSPKNEYHHFYRQAAIFVFAMGENANEEYIVRGVILDHPTPFTLYEMMEQQPDQEPATSIDDQSQENKSNKLQYGNPLGNNLIFRGGDTGGMGVILLHNQKNIMTEKEIGYSGIYQGGWEGAIEACSAGTASANNFKIFFNYCEFTEDQLESLLSSNTEVVDGSDLWCSVEVESSIILNDEWDRGDCWSKLRNAVSSYMT